jgi:Tfp pilus assembly protein PilO
MFCARCGQGVEDVASFCRNCGTSVLQPLPTQQLIKTGASNDARKTAAMLVFMGSCILAWVSATMLNGLAEVVALVCIAIFCFGWSKRGIGPGPKILFCGLAVLLVLILSDVQAKKAERSRIEALESKQRQVVELQKREAEAFSKLTPIQHLDRARTTLKVGADPATLALANKDLDVLKDTDLRSQANQLRSQYEISEQKAKRAAVLAAEKSAKDEKVREAAIERVLRDQMAKSVENSMLDEGYNVDVSAEGPDHTTLRFKWIFVSKVFAHQLSQRSEVFENARKIGFKKIVATDGYDETWTWKL